MSLEVPVRPADTTVEKSPPAPEVLIREARLRQRRRWLVTVSLILIVGLTGWQIARLVTAPGGGS